MSAEKHSLTCSMCGHTFDPTDQVCCQGCPVQTSCALVRCPACGFENVDPSQSQLAQLFKRLLVHSPRRSSSPDSRSTLE